MTRGPAESKRTTTTDSEGVTRGGLVFSVFRVDYRRFQDPRFRAKSRLGRSRARVSASHASPPDRLQEECARPSWTRARGRPGAAARLALAVLAVAGPTAAADDPERIHNLDELAARDGAKPYELLLEDGLYASERTIFHDTVTGAEIWRVTHERGDDRIVYYDVPVWNPDGSMMMVLHGSGIGGRYWVAGADAAWLRPLGVLSDEGEADEIASESFSGEVFWAWENVDWVYSEAHGIVSRTDWTTGESTELLDISQAAGVAADRWRIQPPHPLDDRLLFTTKEIGRVFALDVHTLEVDEFVTDGRWALVDGIHRLRWTKDPDHSILIGQNYVLADGQSVLDPVQYTGLFAEELDGLSECMLDAYPNRGGHPDATMQGEWITGNYEGDLWFLDCDGEDLDHQVFSAPNRHHASVSWDGRWYITDNGPGDVVFLRGASVGDSLLLLSEKGRAQIVLAYHYASYADDENAHPSPASSPDGTKVAYDADMLEKGTYLGEATGNADVWVAVLRRPDPPRGPVAFPDGGSITLTWQRALHAQEEMYWNPGNESREVRGYYVLRGEASGGPYRQIHDGVVEEEGFTDATALPGVSYYYVVQSVEHSGLASGYSTEVHGRTDSAAWQGAVRHYYEAELGAVASPMVPQADWWEAAGGWYVGTFAAEPDPALPPEPYPAVVTVTAAVPKAGSYRVWARVRAFDGASGSFEVEVGSRPRAVLEVSSGDWQWVSAASLLILGKGEQDLAFATSDPSIGLDAVLLTDDLEMVPTGLGAWDTESPAAPEGLQLVVVDAQTRKLVWEPSAERDFHHYNVHCGRDGDYALDNHRLLLSPVVPEVLDWGIPAGWETVYKVTAVDRFGNESAPAVFDPASMPFDTAPLAADDSYALAEDRVLTLAAPGVLANDNDPDGDPMTAILVQEVASGTLSLSPDGGFTYSPGAEWSGTDSFVYLASDGLGESLPATVTITVNAVNDRPVAADDAYAIPEETALRLGASEGVLLNDDDAEGDPLVASLVSGPASGTLTFGADASVIYAPATNFYGTDSFTYRLFDGTAYSAAATVTITVTNVRDPVSCQNDVYAGQEDLVLAVPAPGVLANDQNPDAAPLAVELVSPVTAGTLAVDSDGGFVFVPPADFYGSAEFTYRVWDGTGYSNTASARIAVGAVDDPPIALPDFYTTGEDVRLRVAPPGVLANDSDPDSVPVALLVSGAAHGTVALTSGGAVTYTPEANFSGADSFAYQASDGTGQSAPVTVTLLVEAANDPPATVSDLGYSMQESGVLVVPPPGCWPTTPTPTGISWRRSRPAARATASWCCGRTAASSIGRTRDSPARTASPTLPPTASRHRRSPPRSRSP